MFWNRKQKSSGDQPKLENLVFKSGEAAFEYICAYMQIDFGPEQVTPALVEEVTELKDGRQGCKLKFPDRNGGFSLLGCETLNQNVLKLRIGDLCAYQMLDFMPGVQSTISFLRMPGFIVAKLSTTYSLAKAGWLGARE